MSAVAKFEVIKLQFSDRTENLVGKRENAGNQHFLVFPQDLQMYSFLGVVKTRALWERINSLPDYKMSDSISMGECNTILSTYTLYGHLG